MNAEDFAKIRALGARARAALESPENRGAIVDTIWAGPGETLEDLLDEIANFGSAPAPIREIGCIYQIHIAGWMGFRRVIVDKQTKKRVYFTMHPSHPDLSGGAFHLSHSEFSQAIEDARSRPFDRKHARR